MYNANVSAYNQAIAVFPNSLIANSRNFVKKDFFEAEGSKKQDVKIDLN
jgi:LemA protein